MHVIITRSHSAPPLASFSPGPVAAALALAAVLTLLAAAVWGGARLTAARWAETGHPVLAEVVRHRLAAAESERRALLREKIRLQNDALANLQVRLWQLERAGAAIAANLNLPDHLFPPSDSLMLGVDQDLRPALCRDQAAPAKTDAANPGEVPGEAPGAVVSDNTLESAADLADPLAALTAQLTAAESSFAAAARRAAAVEVLRRTIPMERPLAGKHWRTSLFGYRKDPFTGRRAFHSGYDYAAKTGAPILAAADGVVVYAGRLGNYGNTVQLYHGGGVSTLYGHMRDIAAQQWQFVRRGQTIGAVGNTGRSTGPHLHYEVRFNNRPRPVRKAIQTLKKERGV